MRTLLTSFLISLLIIGCAGKPIRRHSDGRKVQNRALTDVSFIRKRIALLSLFNESPHGGHDLSVTVTEELRKELSRTGEFAVDSKASAEIFGASKEIYSGGGVKLTQLARKAKLSGINLVLYGRIVSARVREKTDEIGLMRSTKAYSEVNIEFRVFDVTSNREIFNQTVRGYANDSTFRLYVADKEDALSYRQELLRYSAKVAARKVIPQLFAASKKMEWTGRVARIIGSKIYLNAGRESGVQVGDIMKVVTEGTEIYDPETGALIGVSQGEVKGTLEVIDYFGPDGAISILHSGGSVVEGDFIQLY